MLENLLVHLFNAFQHQKFLPQNVKGPPLAHWKTLKNKSAQKSVGRWLIVVSFGAIYFPKRLPEIFNGWRDSLGQNILREIQSSPEEFLFLRETFDRRGPIKNT